MGMSDRAVCLSVSYFLLAYDFKERDCVPLLFGFLSYHDATLWNVLVWSKCLQIIQTFIESGFQLQFQSAKCNAHLSAQTSQQITQCCCNVE